ncbi:hypothetical protein KC669_03460 [Candidatus Dojkabacteria bacterium]|uniref:Uncharacterized protein n=1 Tax=Candidatus Dojkabacteria bacterium TaxID=2099670 RepID=A0A955LBN8_9BACT|nr:hypothetical protein [Candidatus Dojkabacteria bacterium]
MAHMNMYQQNEKTIDLDFPKALVIMITIMLFFVLPAQLFTINQKNPNAIKNLSSTIENALNINQSENISENNSEGRVAGTSTTVSLTLEKDNDSLLNSKSFPFVGLGVFFILVSLLGIGYLIKTEKKYKQK